VESIKADGGAAVAVGADMGSVDGPKKLVTEAVNEFGKIDIIVNNGAVWKYEPIEDIKASTFDTFFAINVRGPLLLVQASLPYLQNNGRSSTFLRYLLELDIPPLPSTAEPRLPWKQCQELGHQNLVPSTTSPAIV